MTTKIKTNNAKAIAYHLRQGEDNGGISREALAFFLETMVAHFEAESERIKEQLSKAHIITVARPFLDNDLDCEGDGSGPGCENDVMWEIQAMDASGSHYSYLCSEHLDSYQKWAAEDGRQPLVFEAD